MTRAELYELVWSKPMTHLAKEFGMSDVAVRKHCVKHDIPTPPLGYWAKLAHGKSVKRPPLPTRKRPSDEQVHLSPRVPVSVSRDAETAKQAAELERKALEVHLQVPTELPEKPHSIVRSVRAALRKTKADAEGFVALEQKDLPSVSVGRSSVGRALRLLQTVLTTAESLRYELERSGSGFFLIVNGERFTLRIYAIRDRRPHAPSGKELRAQEWHDRYRAEASDESSERKVYRSWDYFPSDRLTLELRDTNRYKWGEQAVLKRWRDRNSNTLEDRLVETFVWLNPAAVMAREKRLQIEERERKRAEEVARRERLRERKRMAGEVKDYLDKLAGTHDRLDSLDRMIGRLSREQKAGGEGLTRLLREAEAYRAVLLKEFEEAPIKASLDKVELFSETATVIPALLEPDPGWSWLGW